MLIVQAEIFKMPKSESWPRACNSQLHKAEALVLLGPLVLDQEALADGARG